MYMMRKILVALSIVLVASAFGVFAQVKVTPHKVTYKRSKPESDEKKTFDITWPKVSGTSAALARKIEAALNYEKHFDFTIKGEQNDTDWLSDADFKVDYNRGHILCVSLFIEGSGAYPSTSTKYVTVNTRTGMAVKPIDVFVRTAGLKAVLTKMRAKEIADTKASIKKDPENKDVDIDQLFKDSLEYNKIKLDQFTVKSDGVVFHHNYDFPHVVQALQPPGEFLLTWAQLKPYLKSGGLLAGHGR